MLFRPGMSEKGGLLDATPPSPFQHAEGKYVIDFCCYETFNYYPVSHGSFISLETDGPIFIYVRPFPLPPKYFSPTSPFASSSFVRSRGGKQFEASRQ